MPFKYFTVSPHGAEQAEREINAFLCANRILAVDRRWVEQGSASFWSFCIDYLAGAPAPAFPGAVRPGGPRGRVDYREVLKPEEFAVFARLRERRKEIATAEAVPVYTIFTNEQLARMVQTRATTRAGLEKIEGVGDGRLDKYGDRMLEILAGAWKDGDETRG
jgi:superfamily II DNA helicase RecQ